MSVAMVELQQPRTVIPRVDGHDLHILVDHPYVYLRRDDVERIAVIPPWATGETLLLDDDQVHDINGAEYYPLEWAMTRALEDTQAPARARRFLDWLRDELPAYTTDEVLEQAHRVAPFIEAYTVAAAARILDQDPTITIGRDRLFDHMAELGWIERNLTPDAEWVITRLPHDRDWLTLRAVNVGPTTRHGQRRYLQIHITTKGLAELHRTLAGVGRPDPPPAQPTLFD
ncbi:MULTISPECIES: phage antirepressor KilAC domain-containing protein [unclassified Microbacterium]|uniref:phage antirepressor KilAC domain-containing protein n=2 Tax=unclassified Microbacterium TaxID=2609290 RepID=UPI003017C667